MRLAPCALHFLPTARCLLPAVLPLPLPHQRHITVHPDLQAAVGPAAVPGADCSRGREGTASLRPLWQSHRIVDVGAARCVGLTAIRNALSGQGRRGRCMVIVGRGVNMVPPAGANGRCDARDWRLRISLYRSPAMAVIRIVRATEHGKGAGPAAEPFHTVAIPFESGLSFEPVRRGPGPGAAARRGSAWPGRGGRTYREAAASLSGIRDRHDHDRGCFSRPRTRTFASTRPLRRRWLLTARLECI